MKIIVISGSFPKMPCGVGDYTAELLKSILTLAPSIHIDLITTAYPDLSLLEHPRANMHQIHDWNIRSLPRLIRLINNIRPDIVHLQYPAAGYRKGLAPNLLPLLIHLLCKGLPVLVTLHEFGIAHPLRRLSTLFFFLCAHRIIVCDEKEKGAVDRFLRLRRQDAVLLPLAANIPITEARTDLARQPRHSDRLEDGYLTLCYFGLMSKSKNVPFLLEMLAGLRNQGQQVHLLVIGGISREDRSRLTPCMKKLEITDHVSFTGYCPPEEVSRHLAQSDIAILPFRDGVSLRRSSFLAAMQHGLPVVTTRARDYIPAGLSDGYNVLLVDKQDKAGFHAQVRRLIDDARLRVELGRNAAIWGNSFTWSIVGEAHLSLYREISGVLPR